MSFILYPHYRQAIIGEILELGVGTQRSWRSPRGVNSFTVRVQVDALSADFQSDQLAHDFLIDLPHDQLSLLIEQEALNEANEMLYQTFRSFLDRMPEFPSLRKAYNDL